MKKFKFIVSIVCILLALIGLCSCRTNPILNAYSTDYKNVSQIKAADLDIEDICAKKSSAYEYSGYDCYVSRADINDSQKLVINNQRSSTITHVAVKNGLLLGFDDGEFASGIIFYPASGVDCTVQTLSEDRCVVLIKSTNNTCFAVTSWDFYGEVKPTSLYQVFRDSEDNSTKYTTKKICDICNESAIAATIAENKIIYVATNEALYTVKTNGEVKKIDVPKAWPHLLINSIVEVNGSIYIGTHCGVLEYEPESNKFVWFPVEYEDLIPD